MKLIYIHALGCMSCMIMNDRILSLQEKTNLPLTQYNIDFDDIPFQNIGHYFPVTIIMNDDIELERIVGEWDLETMIQKVRRYQND